MWYFQRTQKICRINIHRKYDPKTQNNKKKIIQRSTAMLSSNFNKYDSWINIIKGMGSFQIKNDYFE